MKKCPNCEKTFDDNLKFCQTDGTPLVAVEEAPPEDPYKTTVANASDLPIPPLDPFKTMVASPPPRAEEPKPEVKEDVAEAKEEEIDPMKTIVSTDFPPFKQESKPQEREESKADAPPSPFGSPLTEPKSEVSKDISATPPEPPKFSEPDLNPPNFGEMPPKPTPPPVETPFAPPPVETSSAPPPPLEAPSEPVSPPPTPSKPFEMSQPEAKKSGDFSGDSPYGDTNNAPIPSPFDLSMPPGYQIPSAPMPPYKEAEIEEVKAEALNTPFAEEVKENQQIEQQEPQGWTPPPVPNANWQDQQIGQNTPFQPPPDGVQGQNKTLAFVSLGLGLLSIPCCGFILFGLGAIVTGFMAKSKADNNPNEYGGRGLALAGLIIGAITIVLGIIVNALYFLGVVRWDF